jgi:RNA polymerase sigma-70 factor (ECF subfamily)
MTPTEEESLVERATRGEEAAWRDIYTSTRHRLFALLCYQLGDRTEALDVLQETYLGALGSIGQFRGHGSLESWLCGIALRRARDWKRRFLPRLKRTVSLDAGVTPDRGACDPDPETGRRLHQALCRIPGRQRSAVLLHEWMGYPFADVARTLGTSEATARVHCFRGREALKELLKEDPPLATRNIIVQEQKS